MEVADLGSVENQKKKKTKGVKNSKKIVEAPGTAENDKEKQINEAALVSSIAANNGSNDSGIGVLMFDCSVENHFRTMDMIYKLCGKADTGGFDEEETARLSSTVTFLSEWRYFNHEPRTLRFMPETGSSNRKEAQNDVTLSQYSATSVPKYDVETENMGAAMVAADGRDFVLYVGGLVWALDWCPMPEGALSDIKCEFIAVAAHPPDSTYHKLGAPLKGRGMIQIWCLVNSTSKIQSQAPDGKTARKYQRKTVAQKGSDTPKKPRGRPRKNPIDNSPALVDPEMQFSQALIQLPDNISDVSPLQENVLNPLPSENMLGPVNNTEQKSGKKDGVKEENKHKNPRGRPRKNAAEEAQPVGAQHWLIQALPVPLPGDSTDVPPLADNTLSIPASQEEKGKERKEKKQKGAKLKKNALDKTPAVVQTEGQFTQALILHPSEHTSDVVSVDESMLNSQAPPKEQGRKRKAVMTSVTEIADASDSEEPLFQALAVEFPENMANAFPSEDHGINTPAFQGKMGKRRRIPSEKALNADLECTISELRRRSRVKSKVRKKLRHEGPPLVSQEDCCLEKEEIASEGNVTGGSVSNLASGGGCVPNNVVLPRVVLCLGHDGKVAWDVKWRPRNACESADKHILGYLAVVLGNGSIEVWEVPSPQMIKRIYASRGGDGIDPRFAKLKPVFKCSRLKCGDTQSMPLTVEWSASPPHDLLLAGCHDGMVALWKFSASGSSQDAKPLLCFRAETVPIRALSWAPFEGDPESANVIVTAGHGGLKFWDLRDPFRPLWDANPSQRYIFGLDWSPDPRCVLVSYDDGTIRMVSISRAAYDVPVTGEAFAGTLQQGVHSYCCSSSAIWSIHVSRLTGMAAYCCADGTVLYFQLTYKAVDKDPSRNRAPHFLCGSLADEKSVITINTDLPTVPHLMKKSATEWSNTPRPPRSVASGSNQAKRVKKGSEKKQKPDGAHASAHDNDNILGDTTDAQTTPPNGKGKVSKSNKANNDQALICPDENGDGEAAVKGEVAGGEIEDPPPSKMVSMYKVRWNMNKGSERWLCYGAAGGIVRCQEIIAPVFDKKLLRQGPA